MISWASVAAPNLTMSLVMSNIPITNNSQVDNHIWSQANSPMSPFNTSLSSVDHLVNIMESSANTFNTTTNTTLHFDTILKLLSTNTILGLIQTIYYICASIFSSFGLLFNLIIVWIIFWQKRLTTYQTPTNVLLLQLAVTGIGISFLTILDLVQWQIGPNTTTTKATMTTNFDNEFVAAVNAPQTSLTATLIDLNNTSNNNNNDYAATTTNKLLNIITSPQSSHKNISHTTISNGNITTEDNDDGVIENIINVRSVANLTSAPTTSDPSQQQFPSSLLITAWSKIVSLIPMCINLLYTVQIWTVAALAIDRYCAISNPLHYLRFVYAKRTMAFIAFAWIFSLTLNVIVPFTLDHFTSLSATTFKRFDNNDSNNNNNISHHLVRARQLLSDQQRRDNDSPIVLNSILTSNQDTNSHNQPQHHSSINSPNDIDVSDNRKINRKDLLDNNVSSQGQSEDLGDENDVECFGEITPFISDDFSTQSIFISVAALWSPSKSATQWLWNNNNHRTLTDRKLSKCGDSYPAESVGSNSMRYTDANSASNIGLPAKEASQLNEMPNESHEHQRHSITKILKYYSITCLTMEMLMPLLILILCNINIYYIAKNHKNRMLIDSGRSNKQTPTPSATHTPSHHHDLEANRKFSLATNLAKKRQLLTRLSSSQSLTTTSAVVPKVNENVGHHQVHNISNKSDQRNILLSNNSDMSKTSRAPVERATSLQDNSLIPASRQFETNRDQMQQQDQYQQLCQDCTNFTAQSRRDYNNNLTTTDTKPEEKPVFAATGQKSDEEKVQQVMSHPTDVSLANIKNDALNRRSYYASRQSSLSSIQLPNCIDQNRHKCCRRTNSRASLISASHSVKMNNNSRQQSIVSFSDNLPNYITDHHTGNRDALEKDTSDKTLGQTQSDDFCKDRMRFTRNGSSRHERNCVSLLVNHPTHQSPVNHTNHYACHQNNLRNHHNDVDSIAHTLKIAGLTLAGIKSDKCKRENHYRSRVHQCHGHCQAKINPNLSNCMCVCYDCTIYSFQSYSHTSNSSLNCYPLLLGGMTAGVIAAPQGSSCGFSQVATSVGVRKHDAFSVVFYLILGLLLFALPHHIMVTYTNIKNPYYAFSNYKGPLSDGPDEKKWFAILSIVCRLLYIAMIPVNAWLYGIRSRTLRSTMRRVLRRYISRRQASIEINRRRKSSPSIRSRDSLKKDSVHSNENLRFPFNQTSSQNIPTLLGRHEVCDCRRGHSCCASIMDGAIDCLVDACQNCLTLEEHRTFKNHEKSCAKRRNFLFRNSGPIMNPFAVLHSVVVKMVSPEVPGVRGFSGSKSNNLSSNQDCKMIENECCSSQVECAHRKESATQSSMSNIMKRTDGCCQSANKQIGNQQSEEDCSHDLTHVTMSTPNRFQNLSSNTESSAGSTVQSDRDDDQMLTLLLKKTRGAKVARLQRCLAINQSDFVSSKFKKTASDDRWAASDRTSDSSRRVSSASTLESSLVLSTTSTKCQCNCSSYHIQDCLMACHQKLQQLPLSEQASNSTTATTVYQQSQTATVLGRKYSGCNCQSVSRRCSTIHNPQLSFDSPQRAYNENDFHLGLKQRSSIDSEYDYYDDNLGETDIESQFSPENGDSNRSSDTQNVLAKIGFGFGLGFGIGFGHCSSNNSKSDLKETRRSWRTRHSIPSTDTSRQVDEQERLALLSSTKRQSDKHPQIDTATSKLDIDPQDSSRMRSSKMNQRRRHSHSHCDSFIIKRTGSIQLETISKLKLDHGEQGPDNLQIKITSYNHEMAGENDACRGKKNDRPYKYSAPDERRTGAADDLKKMLVSTFDRSKQCGYSSSTIENSPSCLRSNHHPCNLVYPLSNHKDAGNIKNNSCRTNDEKTAASTRYPNVNIDENSLNIKDTMNENYSTHKPMTADCKCPGCAKDLQCSNKNSSPQDEKMYAVTQNTISVTTKPNKCDTVVNYEDNNAIYTSISLKIKERRKSEIELSSPSKITIDTKKSNIPSATDLMLTHCSPSEVSEFLADCTDHQIDTTLPKTVLHSVEQNNNNNFAGKQTISSCIVVPKFLTRDADRTTNYNKSKSRSLMGPHSVHNGLHLEQRTLTGYGTSKTSVNSLLNAINIMTSQSTKDDQHRALNDSNKDKENVCSHSETKAKDMPVEYRSSSHRLLPPTTIQLSCAGGARQIVTNTLLSPIREGSANHSCASSQTSLNNSSIHNLN